MSAVTAAAAGLAAPAARPRRADAEPRRLRVVEPVARRRRPRLAYGIIALTGALLIGGTQMALSILTTQGSYELSALTQQQREQTWKKQILYDDVAGLSSPQYLAANASALGMVIAESPSYLRLSDGAVLGPGSAALGASSVDALGRAAVPNDLIAETPLVTAPDATIEGAPVETVAPPADGTGIEDGVANTPPALTDGLPTPSTH